MNTEWNWAHLHLLINHLPVVGILLIAFFAIYAVFQKDDRLLRLSGVFTLLIGIASIPVAASGLLAQDIAHELPWASEAYMHKHEPVALGSLAALLVFGVWMVLLQRKQANLSKRFQVLLIAWLLSLSASFGGVAYLGGKIVHVEIRPEEPLPIQMPPPKTSTHPTYAAPMTDVHDTHKHEHRHQHAD